jgi:hypothetical protein
MPAPSTPVRRAVWLFPWLCIPALLLATVRLAQWLMPSGAATTPDSVAYLAMAQNIARGAGLTVPNVGLEGAPAVPLTLWPPLYPLFVSAFLPLARAPEQAASLANTAALAGLVLLSYLLCRRWLPQLAAAGGALVVVLLPAMQLIYSYAWSEALCAPLLLLCFLALLRFGDAEDGSRWQAGIAWLGLAAAACILCIHTRYAAVAFVPPLAATVLFLRPRLALPARAGLAAGAILLVAAGVAPLMLHNLAVSGHLSGGERGAPPQSLGGYLEGLAASFSGYMFRGQPWLVAVPLVAHGLLAWFWRSRPGAADPADRARSRRQDGAALPLGWVLAYLAAITLMGRSQHIDNDARMLALIVPLMMLTVLAASAALARRAGGVLGWLPLSAWAAWCLFNSAASMIESHSEWRSQGAPIYRQYGADSAIYNNFTRNPHMLPWLEIAGAARLGGTVFCDCNALAIQFVTGTRTRQLPEHMNAATVARIDTLAEGRGVMIASRARVTGQLEPLYGPGLRGLKQLPVGDKYGIMVLELPLPLPLPLPPDAAARPR